MKKLLFALTLVLCLAISMVAFTSCGGNGEGEGEGEGTGDVCVHEWTKKATTDKAATCTEEGSATIKCVNCGEKKADSVTAIPATGHSYNSGNTVAPTCINEGSVTKTCTACGDVKTESIPATGEHRYQANASIDTYPTCTVPGQKSVKCVTCQGVKEGSVEVIPASHDWDIEATIDTAPTETEEGQKSVKCLNCGEIKPGTIIVIPALNAATYSYPMDSVVVADGTIDHSKIVDNAQHKYKTDKGEKVVFIDISEYNYNTVTLTPNGVNGCFTFLRILPTEHDQTVNYAFNYNDMIEFSEEITVAIPDRAKYLVVVNNDNEGVVCLPEAIVFSNSATPSANLRDDSLTSYEYPLDGITPSQGTIMTGGTFVSNYWWNSIIIDLDGIVFNQIALQIGEPKSVWFAFLTDYPIVDAAVSYVGGATSWTDVEGDPGDMVTVDIPAEAKCIVIVWMEKEGSAFVYYAPTAIIFKNSDTEIGGGNTDPTPDPTPDPNPNPNPAVANPLDNNLLDDTLNKYSYPVENIVSAGGAIIYWDKNGNANKFYTNYNNDGVGYYQNAFIEITDTVFDYVSFISNGIKTVGWAFVSELPVEGEVAQYIGTQGFSWGGSTFPVDIEIPDGAKYLVVYYQEGETPYLPSSITFSKEKLGLDFALENETYRFAYPMDQLVPQTDVINYYGDEDRDDDGEPDGFVYGPVADKSGWRIAIIDISAINRENLTNIALYNAEKNGYLGYTFLKETPVLGEEVEFATGYSKFEEKYPNLNYAQNITIPEDAKYFVIWYQDSDDSQYVPQSIIFCDKAIPNS